VGKGVKYILCSCLSQYKGVKDSISLHSNTSHVLVYLTGLLVISLVVPFKYISCSCLSNKLVCNHAKDISFKYLSCSCLSMTALEDVKGKDHSNTSHVLVYLGIQRLAGNGILFKYIPCSCLSARRFWKPGKRSKIQIHPMFLFI